MKINNQEEIMNTEPIIPGDDIDFFALPRRPYEFNRGDRRFTDREFAIEYAERVSGETGVRQMVLRQSAPHFVPGFWVVQAVGS